MSFSNFKTCTLTIFRIFSFLLGLNTSVSLAQSITPSVKNPAGSLGTAIENYNKHLPFEKLFVHTDKNFYTLGDTLWFKSYLFNGLSGSYSTNSGIVYLDLITDSAVVTRSISVPTVIGLSWGQIILQEDSFKEGFYTLRAYTNWMQNFGEEAFFSKRVYIANPAARHWVLKQQNSLSNNANKQTLNYLLQFGRADKETFGYKTIQWQLSDGRKTQSRGSHETLNNTLDGSLDISNLRTAPVMRLQEKGGDKQQLAFPLIMNHSPNIDLQFMPEGGHMVAGLPCRVAFKALDIYGKGIAITGSILNNKNEAQGELQTSHNGMGAFNISPVAGESYYVLARWADGFTKKFELPAVKSSGTTLQVSNYANNDSIRITVFLSTDKLDQQEYKFLGLSDGQPMFSASFKAVRPRITIKVPKALFPGGIAHFSLFNSRNEPLNERITFINHHDELDIRISPNKEKYGLRDSVSLLVQVSDKKGNPIEASLSLAVTDDSQVKADLLQANIMTETLFGARLKGHIEDPAWYFEDAAVDGEALDLLMLCQGWVGYNWKDMLNPEIFPAFAAQPKLQVSGKVTNVLNKPVANAKMLLLAKGKYSLIRDTLTNAEGRFLFKDFPPVDTVSFIVQSRNAKGRSFGIGLEMDAIKPAAVTLKHAVIDIPWFVSSEATPLQLIANKEKLKSEDLKQGGSNLLKQVVITGKRTIPKSKNLNGPGEADQIIDEKEAQAAGQQSLIDFLRDRVKGFSLRSRDTDQFYYLNDKRLRFVVDGMELNRFYAPDDPPTLNQYYNFINDALSSLSADQILGVEVMYNLKYTSQYSSSFLTTDEMIGPAGRALPPPRPGAPRQSIRDQFTSSNDIAYLEITTRSGQGIFFRKTPGIAVYRPLPLTWPKEFYRPRYFPSAPSKTPDFRSTLHWQPAMLSNKEGKSSSSFYTSDIPGTYTVIIQGSDMGGLVGFKSIKLKVEK